MSSDRTVLRGEIDAINKLENEMYNFYVELLTQLKNKEIKEKIDKIKNEEEAHARMVAEIEMILGEELTKE